MSESQVASKNKIDKETAEEEFFRFCENNEIDSDMNGMNDEEQTTFEEIKKRFVKACVQGRVEVDGTSLKYTISDFSPEGFKGTQVVLKRPGGHAFSSMDGIKKDNDIKRLVAYMSEISGQDLKWFTKIDASDWKFISSIANCFLSI